MIFSFSISFLMQVFVVADGGLDLEHFEPRSFAELQSILMQVSIEKQQLLNSK